MDETHTDSEKEPEVISLKDGSCPGSECMDLVVQGKPLHYHGPRDVRSLLESQGENAVYANVRINGSVLSRRDFENIPLNEGDEVDFLYYMGGGANANYRLEAWTATRQCFHINHKELKDIGYV